MFLMRIKVNKKFIFVGLLLANFATLAQHGFVIGPTYVKVSLLHAKFEVGPI